MISACDGSHNQGNDCPHEHGICGALEQPFGGVGLARGLFDFSHLAHLDPDSRTRDHFLPEASRIKMPLWAMDKWANLGFVRLSLPRHYGRRARERLEADPGDADLR